MTYTLNTHFYKLVLPDLSSNEKCANFFINLIGFSPSTLVYCPLLFNKTFHIELGYVSKKGYAFKIGIFEYCSRIGCVYFRGISEKFIAQDIKFDFDDFDAFDKIVKVVNNLIDNY